MMTEALERNEILHGIVENQHLSLENVVVPVAGLPSIVWTWISAPQPTANEHLTHLKQTRFPYIFKSTCWTKSINMCMGYSYRIPPMVAFDVRFLCSDFTIS